VVRVLEGLNRRFACRSPLVTKLLVLHC
jgi:hypothetical protein